MWSVVPELPEVETIVRGLRAANNIVGKTIINSQVLWQRSLAVPLPVEFHEKINGQQVLAVDRRGKFIIIRLTSQSLLIHLRMSGDIFVETGEINRNNKHDRVLLDFDDGSRLAFNDTRKFGRVWLVDDPQTVFGKLGLEPLEESLTIEIFIEKLSHSKRQIKPLLLDQTFLAGLGNIYTDEALFIAGIHPCTPACLINTGKAAALLNAIREVLLEGIKRNGASIDWVYRGGDFQNHFNVYQRDGEACHRCGTLIERITLGQRGTHFCPRCQPLKA
ncbi:MAG: DNA-formamidopyrimidine glycosylase [Anaerolinea sp.]|nr:DNA-formamidopyrimidine glycosylase [Anaerolinea sp.]